jgi:hypothetical protein
MRWPGSGVRQTGTTALLAILVSAAPPALGFLRFRVPALRGWAHVWRGFPVELGAFGELYAPSFMERRLEFLHFREGE